MLCTVGFGAERGDPGGFARPDLSPERLPGVAAGWENESKAGLAGCLRKRMVQSVLEEGRGGSC